MDKKAALKANLWDYTQRLYYCSNTADGRKAREEIEREIKQIEKEIEQLKRMVYPKSRILEGGNRNGKICISNRME